MLDPSSANSSGSGGAGGPIQDGNPTGNPKGSGSGPGFGPSPTTAVAMIILYSITGIITVLFLIIIITGAIRAHRHPERYGPRNIIGRPRQSRAKGLARAVLETLPIVKFGENDEGQTKAPSTDRDMELGSVEHREEGQEGQEEATKDENGETKTTTTPPTGHGEIVDNDSHVCSICTEDFAKGQELRQLPCKHQFHATCLDPWLLNVSGTCPLW